MGGRTFQINQLWRLRYVQPSSSRFGGTVQALFFSKGSFHCFEFWFWVLNFVLRQGFTDPDYASLYVADVDCELAGIDQLDPKKILQSSFATVIVKMTPKPRPDDDAAPPVKAKGAEAAPEEPEDDDDSKSVESKSTQKSKETKTSSKRGDIFLISPSPNSERISRPFCSCPR